MSWHGFFSAISLSPEEEGDGCPEAAEPETHSVKNGKRCRPKNVRILSAGGGISVSEVLSIEKISSAEAGLTIKRKDREKAKKHKGQKSPKEAKSRKKMNNQPGKDSNLKELIAEHQPRLKAFIRKRVSSKEDAEDILQDVFYQLVKTIETTFNPIEQVTAWLYRVTRNTIINKSKKMQEEELPSPSYDKDDNVLEDFSEVLFGESAPSPETEYMRSLVWQELEVALSELPPEQREAFELMEMEGIPAKELSQTTGVPVNSLLSRKHYAVLHLRKRLKGLYNDLLNY